MKLKNFDRYDFSIEGQSLICRNVLTGKFLSPIMDRYHDNPKFGLRDNNGNKRFCSALRIAFALRHGITITEIPKNVRFYGTVDNPVIGKRPKSAMALSPYQRIQELEQSLEMMKYAYYSGDFSPFVKFAYENKKVAIATVSKRLGISIPRLQDFWDYGVEIFLESLKEMKFTSLKPIINYYCTCLKYGYLRNKDKSLPVIESIISDSPIPRKRR